MVLEDIGCLGILLVMNAVTGCLALKECGGCRRYVSLCSSEYGCIAGCIDGFWGKKCDNVCNKGCNMNTCRQIDGNCAKGCAKGFTGNKCDTCETGLFGPPCQPCPTNCMACVSETNCTVCKEGFWGETCRLVCSPGCSSSFCRKQSGQCEHHCKSGYWGLTCSSTCSPTCRLETCNYTRGTCDDGCKVNFYGDLCEMDCESTCLPDVNGRRCFDTNGSCTQYCKDGYYGKTCKERCNKNCVNNKCSKDDGACNLTCCDGFEGDNCTQACNHITLDANEPSNSFNIGLFIGVGTGTVAATLIAVGILTLRYISGRRQRQNSQDVADFVHGSKEMTPQNKSDQPDQETAKAGVSLYEQLQDRNESPNAYSEVNMHPDQNMYSNTNANYEVLQNKSTVSVLYSQIYDNYK